MEENQSKVHIPDGWQLNKLGSVCRIKKGVQFNKVELSDSGMYPCINGGIEPSGWSDLWNSNENTITISEGGNSCGYVNFIETKFWSGGHCYSLLDLRSDTENDFLYQALKGRQSLIMDLRVGSGLPNIQQKAIKEFEFLRPDNKPEQTQIATILSKVDEAIAQTEQLIAKYSRIKTGLLQDLLTKGVDKNGNIRSEETHEFKDSPLGRIPKDWECVNFGEYIELVHGYQFRNYDFTETGTPIVKIGQVKENGLDLSHCSFINPNRTLLFTKQTINNGDVLMALTGATLGKACMVSGLNNPVMQNYRVGRFEPIFENDVDKTFLFFTLKSTLFLAQIFNNVNEAAQGNVGKSDFKKSYFIKPPFLEQSKIVRHIEKVFGLVDDFNLELNKYQSLKTGLMQDLLSGKVRVNHLIKETASV